MSIKIMPQQLANQIAAGEVVERPASVIKELVENSIDAGATEIKISVENAGSQYIKIEDNGSGIPKSDLIMSLKRHATSKIETISDLAGVQTMGFRGEALASIASVARVRLTSKFKDAADGWQIYTEGGSEPEISAAQHPQGTTLEVMDLFFNVPARKRFMRKEATEWGYIDDLMKRLALAHHDITFFLFKSGKLSRRYASCVDWLAQQDRLKGIFGQSVIGQLRPFKNEMHGLMIRGYLGLPTLTRAIGDQQFVIVNNRVIKDPMIANAMKRAYQGLTYQGRQPVYVLNITVDFENVDVNVHPTKERIRFDQSQLVNNFIYKSARDALSNTQVASSTSTMPDSPPVVTQAPEYKPLSIGVSQQQTELSSPRVAVLERPIPAPLITPDVKMSRQSSTDGDGSLGYAIEQIHGVYILARNQKGLLLIDMHAAHERILLERLRLQYNEQGIGTQSLLLPLVIELTQSDYDVYHKNKDVISQLGFKMDGLGDISIKVLSVPMGIDTNNIKDLIVDVIAELREYQHTDQIKIVLEKIFATISCHAAIRANRTLTSHEMNDLLRQIESCAHASVCNHGRPTTVELGLSVLDKLFNRGQ